MICLVIDDPDLAQNLPPKVSFIELRLDLFPNLDLEKVERTIRESKVPVIATLRPKREGGRFDGSEEDRLSLLQKIAKFGPAYIDLEHDVPEEFLPDQPTIRSYHNFESTPGQLEAFFERMQKQPASLYKIAANAQDGADTLRMIHFAKNKKNLIAFCMGEEGVPSRIAAPILGAPFTYAAMTPNAPGQPTLKELEDVYHLSRLNRDTALYGLFGDPAAHSLGHLAHNRAYQALELNALYLKFRIPSEKLSLAVEYAKKIPIQGLSITMPHKEAILPFLDSISQAGERIGAVNTVVTKNGQWHGDNTDGIGAVRALEPQIPRRAVVLGAGGAARAIVDALLRKKSEVIVLNRSVERARQLARDLPVDVGKLEDLKDLYTQGYDLLVNTTPDPMPVDPNSIPENICVMDINVRAGEPLLLQEAKRRGCRTIDGRRMFREQAIEQVKLWNPGKWTTEEIRRAMG